MPTYWGDFHRHVISEETAEQALAEGRQYLDIFPALLYPYEWEELRGMKMETTRPQQSHRAVWQQMHPIIERHNDPGSFVAMMAFEWHGNRQAHGDYNVFYFHGAPQDLVFPDTLAKLYDHLRECKALAFPHHTAYPVGHCGTNFAKLDPKLSPATDLFSAHGSSEMDGFNGPLDKNASMGPGCAGATAIDALNCGHHIGLIASNDGIGLPGSWGRGLTAVKTDDLTREGVYAAFQNRSVYGVTGDRIALDFHCNGQPMGSVIHSKDKAQFDVHVTGSDAIDRIELIRNGIVIGQHCHAPQRFDSADAKRVRAKCRFTFGWGPCVFQGFKPGKLEWDVQFDLQGAKLRSVEKCFSQFGNFVTAKTETQCKATLTTTIRPAGISTPGVVQSLILEIEGDRDAAITLLVNGETQTLSLADLLQRSQVIVRLDEAKQLLKETFGVSSNEYYDDDPAYHNARKVLCHLAATREAYEVNTTFTDQPPADRESYYYIRVTQMNGQMAWSSPIWVDPTVG